MNTGKRSVSCFVVFMNLIKLKAYAGDDYEMAHVPAGAREVLKSFDLRSQHYELVEELHY